MKRRAFVLIAVLVVVASSLLVATALLYLAQAELATDAGARARSQSRLLAWSGVQAAMTRLDEQRDEILSGRAARLDREYVIYEEEGREGVVRLLPLGAAGEILVPEAGRVDLNAADAAMLEATGLLESKLASAVVAHRDGALGGAFQSVGELLGVPGMRPEVLYGPLDELAVDDGTDGDDGAPERTNGYLDETPRGLADVVTVYGVEPAIQRNGRRRINLNVPWSDVLGRRVDERFGEGASEVLRQIFDRGTKFESEARIYQVLRQFNTEPEEWPDIVDALTTEEGAYHYGRLDINTAPFEALTALSGFDEQQAAQIVQTRDTLTSEERATVAWPVIAGIVPPEAYDELAGRITTRSWTYRLRLIAGERRTAEPEPAGGSARPELDDAVIFEAVIDLSDPKPRVAYLREVTLLETAARLMASAEADAYDDREDALAEAGPVEDTAGGAPSEDADSGMAGEEDPGTSSDPTPAAGGPPEATPEAEDRRVGRWRRGR